jgi:hypothetical protein
LGGVTSLLGTGDSTMGVLEVGSGASERGAVLETGFSARTIDDSRTSGVSVVVA